MRHETNVEFISRVMEFSPQGALTQLFILDAVQKSVDAVTAYSAEELEEAFKDTLVSGAAWHATAAYLKAELEKR